MKSNTVTTKRSSMNLNKRMVASATTLIAVLTMPVYVAAQPYKQPHKEQHYAVRVLGTLGGPNSALNFPLPYEP
jgi:hypothetical protein